MATTIQNISTEELAAKVRRGADVQILNVLEPDHYDLGAIRNSMKIPLSQLTRRIEEVDLSKPVITYCAGPQCPASRKAAEILADAGYDVRAYEGGMKEWTAAGLQME